MFYHKVSRQEFLYAREIREEHQGERTLKYAHKIVLCVTSQLNDHITLT